MWKTPFHFSEDNSNLCHLLFLYCIENSVTSRGCSGLLDLTDVPREFLRTCWKYWLHLYTSICSAMLWDIGKKVMGNKNKTECVCVGFSCFFSLLVAFFLNNPWVSQHISWGDTELYCCVIGILGALLLLLRAASSQSFTVKYMHLQMCWVWKHSLCPALTTQQGSLIYLFVFPLVLQKYLLWR